MMPIREMVIFPHMMTPFVVGREKFSVRALEEALNGDRRIFLATQHDASVDEPTADDIYTVGVIGNIVQSVRMPDGNIKVLVEGVERARASEVNDEDGFFVATVKTSKLRACRPTAATRATRRPRHFQLFEQYAKLQQSLNSGVHDRRPPHRRARQTRRPHRRQPSASTIEEKQQLLEVFDPEVRLTRVADTLDIAIEKLNMDRTIQSRVKRQMERAQKEYYLNEKIKAIQKELGRGEKIRVRRPAQENRRSRHDRRGQRESHAGTQEARSHAAHVGRVHRLRNYLDWLLAVPWKKRSKEIRSID